MSGSSVRILRPFTPHTPTPKQAEFLCNDANNQRVALYGGAAGGGKSDALLMGALQYVDVDGYAALIVRRTYRQLTLEDSILDRMHKWMRRPIDPAEPSRVIDPTLEDVPDNVTTLLDMGLVSWSAKYWRYEFVSGATITFGHLQNEDDKYNYQGPAFHYVAFDELTQFTKTQFEYLAGRLRKPARGAASKIPLRLRAGSNPGGKGHLWVKAKFVERDDDSRDNLFVPAVLDDNPYLDESYEESLAELDPVTHKQLRYGDWEIVAQGNMFKRDSYEIVEPGDVPPADDWVVGPLRYWDFAATEAKAGTDPDYTAGVKVAYDGGYWYVLDVVHGRWDAGELSDLVLDTAIEDGIECEIWWEEEGGASGKYVSRDLVAVLEAYAAEGHRKTGSKATMAKPVASKVRQGLVRLVRAPWNEAYIVEHEQFPNEAFHDDQVDATGGAFDRLSESGMADTEDTTEGGETEQRHKRWAYGPE